MRTIRMIFCTALLLGSLLAMQLGTATTASAATTCKHYDSFTPDPGATPRTHVDVCAAPAKDYPDYKGWGRTFRGTSFLYPCGYSLLPYDVDDHRMVPFACPNGILRAEGFQWTGSAWTPSVHLGMGTRVYIHPFATGWRWIWTAETGWAAMRETDLALRWYAG